MTRERRPELLLIVSGLWTVLTVTVNPCQAIAQEEPGGNGRITGVVRDASTGEPIAGATILVVGTYVGDISDVDGSYTITELSPGTYQLQVAAPGRADAIVEAQVTEAEVGVLDINLGGEATVGDVIVMTGSRSPEKVLDSPVTIEVVSEDDLATAGGVTYLSALSGVKGVDYSNTGVGEQRVSMRGFNTQFNSRLLTMVDGRIAQLPGSGLPQGTLLPTPTLDIRAVEVVVGPASALYGPNAHTGVINVITKSPWDEPGAAVALRGGTQSLTDVSTRVAGTISDDFGWKVNGQLMRAEDFAPDRDLAEHYYGTSIFEADLVDDYSIGTAKVDGSLYYRFAEDWVAKGSYGWSLSDGFSLTNGGRNHIRDWEVSYQNLQISSAKVYAQVTRTATDAGGTYQLDRLARTVEAMGGISDGIDLDAIRDDIRFVDHSQLIDAEVQYRERLRDLEATTGLQLRSYLPDSGGTYLADAADVDISATEVGGYLQLSYPLFDERLAVVGAGRIDHHSNYPTQISPKASAVFDVAPRHKVRAGYSRAFKSPTVLESDLLINDVLRGNSEGYTIRDSDGAVVATIDPLVPEQVNAVELGYKGAISDALYVDAVAYNSWYRNFISPLTQVANPMATDPTFAFDPDGSLVADGTAGAGTLFTYQNFGAARVRGVDAGVTWFAVDGLELAGSVSVIDLASFSKDQDSAQADLLLNVPALKLKGSITARDLGIDDYFVKVSGRFQSAYEFESGYWNSNVFDDGEVPARFVADLTAGYALPEQGLVLTATVANLLDDHRVDVVGAPVTRRFVFAQLEYRYDGLVY